MKPEIEDQLRDLAKDIPQSEWDELEKEREFLIDLILELFNQACRIEGDEIRYSHDGISIYKDAQAFLIKEGRSVKMSTGINYLDEVWNPQTGCSGKGCPTKDTCWAKAMVKRFPAIHGYYENEFINDDGTGMHPKPIPFSKINFHPSRLDKPLHWKKPKRVGVCFLGDLFDEQVPDEWIDDIFDVMTSAKKNTFFILTKQPERMANFCINSGISDDMSHVYHGITITSQADADRMLPELWRIPGKKWISYEPALGPADFSDYIWIREVNRNGKTWKHGFNFIVIGCHNRPQLYPCPHEWMIDVVEQCRAAGIPCFVKQIDLNGKCCTDITKFPKELQVREWPE